MKTNFEIINTKELEDISGGSVTGALALAWGVTKAAAIVGGTAVTVYGAGKGVKAVGDWIISRF